MTRCYPIWHDVTLYNDTILPYIMTLYHPKSWHYIPLYTDTIWPYLMTLPNSELDTDHCLPAKTRISRPEREEFVREWRYTLTGYPVAPLRPNLPPWFGEKYIRRPSMGQVRLAEHLIERAEQTVDVSTSAPLRVLCRLAKVPQRSRPWTQRPV